MSVYQLLLRQRRPLRHRCRYRADPELITQKTMRLAGVTGMLLHADGAFIQVLKRGSDVKAIPKRIQGQRGNGNSCRLQHRPERGLCRTGRWFKRWTLRQGTRGRFERTRPRLARPHRHGGWHILEKRRRLARRHSFGLPELTLDFSPSAHLARRRRSK